MDRATHMVCPNCHAALTSQRGVRIGRKVKCPRCSFLCTVRGEDAEPATAMNTSRLGVVLGGVLLYVLGGAGLAVYCLSNNVPAPAARTSMSPSGATEDDGAEPPPPPLPPPPAPAPVSTAEQRRIDDAIARGVWFLKDHTLPTGTWGDSIPGTNWAGISVGFSSLPGLTLLECGVLSSDPVVQKAAAHVRQQASGPQGQVTYQAALAILFLDRLAGDAKLIDGQDDPLIQYLALGLIAGQNATEGAWHYNCPALDRGKTAELLRLLSSQNKLLTDDNSSLNAWRKTALPGGNFDTQGWDNSNTQFAILALWAAQRHGVAIDGSIGLAEKHFRGTQQPSGPDATGNNLNLDGSWLYDGGQNSSRWPSMTCAGLLALAEAHALSRDPSRKQQRPQDDPAIQRALAMLAREIDRPDEQRPPDLYFLWSLERVGVLYDLPKIGDKDWYRWGVNLLLARQQADGSWKDGGYYGNNPVLDTCFALLFLEQANLTRDLTTKLQLLQKR